MKHTYTHNTGRWIRSHTDHTYTANTYVRYEVCQHVPPWVRLTRGCKDVHIRHLWFLVSIRIVGNFCGLHLPDLTVDQLTVQRSKVYDVRMFEMSIQQHVKNGDKKRFSSLPVRIVLFGVDRGLGVLDLLLCVKMSEWLANHSSTPEIDQSHPNCGGRGWSKVFLCGEPSVAI